MVRYDESDQGPEVKPFSEPAATTPAIVGICLGATLFLVGIVAVTLFFYRRKSFVRRKSGVYLTPHRSPLSEHMPLQSRLVIHRRSDTSPSSGNLKSQHLVNVGTGCIKKSPSPPIHFTTPKNLSPITPPMEDSTATMTPHNPTSMGGNFNQGRFSTTAEIHQKNFRSPQSPQSASSLSLSMPISPQGNCNNIPPSPQQSLKLTHRDNSLSPRGSPQTSPLSESSIDSQVTTLNQHNGNLDSQQQFTNTNVSPTTNSTTSMTMTVTSNSTPVKVQNLNGGGANDLGILSFRIRYKKEKGALIVTVVKCEDLPVKDTTLMTCDPYVKLQLLPEKQQRVKTRVLRHTRQPQYDEDFTFYGMQPNQLQAITLHFVVLSFDRYSRDDVIGEVFCPLSTMQLPETDNHHLEISRDIQPRNLKMRSQGRGEVLVSLCWQPTSNRLTCVVLKARNLPKMDVTGLADPYVKLYLLYDGQRVAKKKTHIKKRTLNPVFNESFVFDLPPAATQGGNHLDKISLQLLLLDWDRVTKNEVIGRLEVGAEATSGTATHWTEVLNCPRRQIAEWHKLRD